MTMEVNEVFEKVKNLFVDELGIDAEKVTMEAKLEEDLDIDSLGIVEVVMAFEDEFEIEIEDEELTDVGTVGQAVNLLHSKL
jgi:acyl carrier protein